jgi:hypothetical protein
MFMSFLYTLNELTPDFIPTGTNYVTFMDIHTYAQN